MISPITLAHAAVDKISHGAPGKDNIRPNAVRVTEAAIKAGVNSQLGLLISLLQNDNKSHNHARAIELARGLMFSTDRGHTAA